MKWDGFETLDAFKSIGVLVLLVWIFCCFDIDAALAHSPHDVVMEVELSPNYARDRTAYALLNGYLPIWGNLFQSKDGGDRWTRIEKGLDNQHQISSLAVSSQSSDTLFLSTLGDGIYKSQDEGASWNKVNRGLANLNIDLVAIAPNSSDVVFAAGTESGLYKTENGGTSWSTVMPEDKIKAIAFNPKQNEQIIVGSDRGNIHSSWDRGKNWQQLASLKNSGAIQAVAISSNYETDRTIWVGTEKKGIWETVDGGVTFTIVNNGGTSWRKLPGTAYGGDSYIETITISPDYQSDRTFLISVRGRGLFKTADGGTTFTQVGDYLTGEIQFSPTYKSDRTIYSASGDELYRSIDGGDTWQTTAVPQPDYNFLTILYHFVVSSPERRYLAAAIAALFSYLLLSYLRLGKRLPFRNWQLKTSATFAAFIGVLSFLSV